MWASTWITQNIEICVSNLKDWNPCSVQNQKWGDSTADSWTAYLCNAYTVYLKTFALNYSEMNMFIE